MTDVTRYFGQSGATQPNEVLWFVVIVVSMSNTNPLKLISIVVSVQMLRNLNIFLLVVSMPNTNQSKPIYQFGEEHMLYV